MKSLVLIASTLLTFTVFASTKGIKVIYGEDNRRDVFESTNPAFVELAKSTAAMIKSTQIKNDDFAMFSILGKTLEGRGVCAAEPFAKQLSAANCSGFLVAENLLVTAGHCITSDADCQGNKWVFDYKVEASDQSKMSVPVSSVYSCKKIISRSLDNATMDDYAFIELDRKVTDRLPLKFRRSGKPSPGDELVVIGHPTGLPTKIADGANVRNLFGKYFNANLDTYGGNSGSAVINVKTEEVEGILVRGENDYNYNASLGCQESNHCPDTGCRGEDVTFITNIKELQKI